MSCPTCGSTAPHLHPAVQFEGEVSPCSDDFHRRVTPQNTPERIAELDRTTGAIMKVTDRQRLRDAFAKLTADERALLTCALAGNHPGKYKHLRMPVLRALAHTDRVEQNPRYPHPGPGENIMGTEHDD